jgi:hypothetical protein
MVAASAQTPGKAEFVLGKVTGSLPGECNFTLGLGEIVVRAKADVWLRVRYKNATEGVSCCIVFGFHDCPDSAEGEVSRETHLVSRDHCFNSRHPKNAGIAIRRSGLSRTNGKNLSITCTTFANSGLAVETGDSVGSLCIVLFCERNARLIAVEPMGEMLRIRRLQSASFPC